jgi:hypothetical protein
LSTIFNIIFLQQWLRLLVNPIPRNIHSLIELWDWHQPLNEAEEEWKRNNPE